MGPVIEAQGLSKKYTLGRLKRERYETLRDVVAAGIEGLARRPESRRDRETEDFWALKDVSFRVEAGDRLGVVGRNGAGKSTLLKILSRITAPTEGRVVLAGRVGSLLEVGTGFHPELTGRENIFLNGVILGMSRAEIARRFDEIVAFAEIEPFLDTPAKRYSSGMYVRLAFAVAAHVEPEILIVDEVLAVGDIAFQRKCLSRLDAMGREGRTVIFVSHNLEALSKLCNHGLLLSRGRIVAQGPIAEVMDRYREEMYSSTPGLLTRLHGDGIGGARVVSVWCVGPDRQRTGRIDKMEPMSINLEASIEPPLQDGVDLNIGFGIDTLAGIRLLTCVSEWEEKRFRTGGPKLSATCVLPFVPFAPGTYFVSAAIMRGVDMLHLVERCATFEVTDRQAGYFANRKEEHGALDLPYRFQLTEP